MTREPLTIVEIDIDYCTRTYGTAPCTAALSAARPNKCFNGYRTCQDRTNFQRSTKTLRFCESRSNLPVGWGTVFPAVLRVSETSASVNIAGGDERMSATGQRAQVTIQFQDFVYHDRNFDKYVSERISGAANFTGESYDPVENGTFFTKLHARFPYYDGRPLRVISGYIDSGSFVETTRRNYILREIGVPDERGTVDALARDVFDLASNDKALCPRPSSGYIDRDINTTDTTVVLTPTGIGDLEYPVSGRATLGSEIVSYTRSGDTVTLTGRGIRGSTAATHKTGDTLQVTFSVTNMRVDDFIYTLLTSYASIPTSFCPKVAKWKPEIDKWAAGVLITTDITSPTGVAKVVGELASLGFIVSWSSRMQEIGLRVNRPVDDENIFDISDDGNIKSIQAERRQDDRLSQVAFFTVQTDPTKSLTDLSNYNVVLNRVDAEAQSASEYGTTKVKAIPVRFFNDGADSNISVLAKRLLNRFRDPPTQYRIVLDMKDDAIDLVDVLRVRSSKLTDETGRPVETQLQVVQRTETKQGSEFEVIAQAYQYSGRYGFVTDNARPTYPLSTDAQRSKGAYFSNGGSPFLDGLTAYRFI